MDTLEISYLRAHCRETKRIREYMRRYGELPEEIVNDMYSSERLVEDPISSKPPRVGTEYQVNENELSDQKSLILPC